MLIDLLFFVFIVLMKIFGCVFSCWSVFWLKLLYWFRSVLFFGFSYVLFCLISLWLLLNLYGLRYVVVMFFMNICVLRLFLWVFFIVMELIVKGVGWLNIFGRVVFLVFCVSFVVVVSVWEIVKGSWFFWRCVSDLFSVCMLVLMLIVNVVDIICLVWWLDGFLDWLDVLWCDGIYVLWCCWWFEWDVWFWWWCWVGVWLMFLLCFCWWWLIVDFY